MTLVSKQEFLKRFQKEFGKDASFVREVNRDWEQMRVVAKEVLPHIPQVGFFASSQTKLEAYADVEARLKDTSRRHDLSETNAELVEFLLEYSSKSFKRVLNHKIDRKIDKELYPRGKWISQLGYLVFVVVLGLTFYFVDGGLSLYQILGLVVLAILFVFTH